MVVRMARPVEIRGLYFYRQRVPADIVPKLGKTVVKESLGTRSEAEAKLKFPAVATRWQEYFEQLRRGVQTLTAEQCEAIAGEIYADLIHRAGDAVAASGWAALSWSTFCEGCRVGLDDFVDMGIMGTWPRLRFLRSHHGANIDRFLAKRGMTITDRSYDMLAFSANRAALQACEVILRKVNGDYTPDPQANRFPKLLLPDPTKTFDALYKLYYESKGRDEATANEYRHFFRAMIEHAGTDDMRLITEDHLLTLRAKLLASGKKRKTVKEGYFAHIKAFFAWAKRQKKLPTNPAAEVIVEMPDDERDMRGLTDAEASRILAASLVPFSPRMAAENRAARRWIPWLCAYTGARLNEITQLRPIDVRQVDGVWCLDITPEAGKLKNAWSKRIVPLHSRVLNQGFLDFLETRRGKARLFYDEERAKSKAAAKNLGNKLREWVDDMGVLEDDLVGPFHGWRHRFRTIGLKCGIPEVRIDALEGHAPDTEGKKYGRYEVDVLHAEIVKLDERIEGAVAVQPTNAAITPGAPSSSPAAYDGRPGSG